MNGALQALPIANTGRGFIWNKTTYDKVGAKIPTTLDELYEAGRNSQLMRMAPTIPLPVRIM